MNPRSLKMLALVAGVLLAAVFGLKLTQTGDSSTEGQLLFPDLKQRVNDLQRVTVVNYADGQTASIVLTDASWTVSERDDYPADTGKLRQLILALADAKRLEPKTSDPARYAILGVDDAEGASGQRIVIFGDDFEYSVIIGNQAQTSYRYARIADDAQSWLISGNPAVPDSVSAWLDPAVIDVEAASIRSVTITHADGEQLHIFKDSVDEVNYQVKDIPEGRELSYPSAANGIAGVLLRLTHEDVSSVENVEGDAIASVRFEKFDDEEVLVDVFQSGETSWITVSQNGGGDSSDAPRWMYRVAEYRMDQLLRRWDDILKTEE